MGHHCDVKHGCANLSLAALLLAVAACRGSGDRVFEHTASAPSFTGLVDTTACAVSITDTGAASCLVATGDELWRADVCRPVRHRPAVIGGSLWVACESGEWTALDVKTGRPRWKQAGRGVPVSALASDGPHGFIATADGLVTAIDETGTVQWSGTAGPRLCASGDALATSNDERGVLVLQAASGDRMWSDEKPALALAGSDELIIAARAAGDLVAWDLLTGAVRWGVTLGAFAPDTLSVDDGRVTVGLLSGDVVTLDAIDGAEKQRVRLSGPLVAPVHERVAVVQGREGCALVLGTEQKICVDHQLRGSAVVRDGVLMLGPRDGRVLGYRLKIVPLSP